jgi:ArsR family transcriptional regulator
MDMNLDLAFKALADKHRRQILKRLVQGETCGCTLIEGLPMTQPTLSYHTQLLAKANLISTVKEGTWKKHTVDMNQIDGLIDFLQSLKRINEHQDV